MIRLIKSICLRLDVLIELGQHLLSSFNATDLPHKSMHREELSENELLDIQDVVDMLGISMATYYRLVQRGELRPRRKGKRHYYFKSDIYVQLENSRRKGRI